MTRNRITRSRTTLALTTVGLAGLLGLTACADPTGSAASTGSAAAVQHTDAADPTGLAEAAYALAAAGFDTVGADLTGAAATLVADPDAAPASTAASTAAGGKRKVGPARRLLRRNTLHGEVTIQTKKGPTTVAVQRGTVTAVSAGTVTVKSTDGFSSTWNLADNLRVVKDHKKVDRGAVTVGTQLGIAGAKVQDRPTARLIVVAD